MNLEVICYGLAVPGFILTLVGRRVLFVEAALISTGWAWAIRLLPLADIMFLARFWDCAKSGAVISMAGLVCLLPLGAVKLWEQRGHGSRDFTTVGKALSKDERTQTFNAYREMNEARIAAKQRKLQQLNSHLAAWYTSMEQRRAAIATATPEQITVFNQEAAAYQSLRELTKQEAAELQERMNRRLVTPEDVSNEEYGKFVLETQERYERRAKASLSELPDDDGGDSE